MNDLYYELTVIPSAHLDLFADRIQELFNDAIEIGEDTVIVRSEKPVEALRQQIEAFADTLSSRLSEPVTVRCEVEEKENVDWIAAYRSAIRPVEVPPFYVYPSWESPKEGMINICIDPTLAFGSGHHETTAGCLRALGRYVQSGERWLDVGCGSGILGIAAAKLGARVEACDTDPLAVENAAKNFALNRCAYTRIWEGSVTLAEGEYEGVAANIVADVLIMLAPDLKKRVKKGGLLILSGILDTKEAAVAEKFSDLQLLESFADNEWRTKIYRKQG